MKQNLSILLFILVLGGCRTSDGLLETGEMTEADLSEEEFTRLIPDYTDELQTLSGTGRALVSQPGQSDRLTIDFQSDQETSLMTFKNRVGIEGGEILVKEDSILIYNRIDEIAEKISVQDALHSETGSLAAINLVELFHYPANRHIIRQILQDENFYIGISEAEVRITIDKQSGLVYDVQTPPDSELPYSRIVYEGYEQLEGFYLPRKITILSRDGDSRVVFLVRHLQTNRSLPLLEIQIPDDIPVLTS